ncbi:hypothetical protein F7725_002363 [Dissostichus mawsoni]|uniref:Intraflagellar transport protein 88 homolog n=1 Tax=Dissostichus mawsoni TaxID=36200 RepID=A0A7J5Y257_DISMA|nr:hypothetical protein F7725_002363 [Dissostichus mawsoni]
MENVHLAVEEEDIYSGYNDYNPTFDSEARIPLASSMGRPMTGAVQDGAARPMTAVRAAGYTSSLTRGSNFDPLGQSKGPAPPLEGKNEDTPEEKIKILEKKVNDLIEESCMAQSIGALQLALEKAKEAGRKERALVRQREQSGNAEHINLDLTYSVLLNLANQYANNEMYPEALNSYQVIVKNKMFSNAGRLKVNMANIYVKQKSYPKAIKFYRMALDQISNAHKELRIKIMQDIGVVFVRMGQYSDAITSFEHIMSESPNIKTGFNLILCYYAIGDRERMKKAFQKLISVPLGIDDEDKCVDIVKSSQYIELANDLEINKAITYLRQKDFNQAVETLKTFEKKDSREKDYDQADRYADLAMTADRYNPAALINKGNTVFVKQDYEKAAEFYKEALRNDSSCTEALYNLASGGPPAGDRVADSGPEYYPSNIDVIEWLGAYYIETQFCEKAIQFFERATLIQYVKWQLMVASCYRRSGNYQKALETYKDIHRKFPENVECLRFLVRLCTDMGLNEVQEYATKLKKVEKMKEIREQRVKSGRESSSRGRREGSAGSADSAHSSSTKGERLSAKMRSLPGSNEPYEASSPKEIDASYVDPLGPQMERPKTGAKRRVEDDDFADEELGDDLLPE